MTYKNRLELVWPDKERIASPEPRILIEKEVFYSKERGQKGTENNLLIYDDNLLGLKALERNYIGKIKCIYIDPPYNTKSCFIHYDDSMEHSLWLNMIKDRLLIMRRLLSEDGSIWISIDASESHYLKVVCDEVFGRKNFIEEVVWERAYAPVNLKKTLSRCHDYILVYAKKSEGFELNKLPRSVDSNSRYKNLDNDPRGVWKSGDLSVGPIVKEKVYSITTPSGRVVYPPKGYCWRLTQDRLREFIADGRIWFGKEGNNVPSIKRFLSEVKDGITSMTLWKREDVGDSQEAKREVKQFNSEEVFQTPKPERLIERILHLATNQGDLILDSFAGSGTTGAVAQKMGRRWIMIELNPHCHTHIIPRLQKVIDGTDQGGISKSLDWQGGGSFRLCELAPSLLEQNRLGRWVINKKYNSIQLAESVSVHAGYKFDPRNDPYWMHGYSSENDFIYVTPSTLSKEQLQSINEEVGERRSLLIYCEAFQGKSDEYSNLTIKKIPKTILSNCEWGRDDYSLKVMDALENEARSINQKQFPKGAKIQIKAVAKTVNRTREK